MRCLQVVGRTNSGQDNSHSWTTRTRRRTFSYNDISDTSSFVRSLGPIISTPPFKAHLTKANLKVASHSEPIIIQWVWVDIG